MPLPDDFGERTAALDEFVSCPACGSLEATIEIDEVLFFEDDSSERTDLRGTCPDCGHETPWIYGQGGKL